MAISIHDLLTAESPDGFPHTTVFDPMADSPERVTLGGVLLAGGTAPGAAIPGNPHALGAPTGPTGPTVATNLHTTGTFAVIPTGPAVAEHPGTPATTPTDLHPAPPRGVAGVDEAGRGACCGPIVIAACILPPGPLPQLAGLTDSKKLTAKQRERLFPVVMDTAEAYSVVMVSAGEIDLDGIQWCNVDGMRRAIAALPQQPSYVLTDYMKVDGLPCPYTPVVKGDARVRAISAASILAKVARDRVMALLGAQHPGYGLENHAGYGTAAHMDAVRLHGKLTEHRYTYRNVADAHQEWLRRHR